MAKLSKQLVVIMYVLNVFAINDLMAFFNWLYKTGKKIMPSYRWGREDGDNEEKWRMNLTEMILNATLTLVIALSNRTVSMLSFGVLRNIPSIRSISLGQTTSTFLFMFIQFFRGKLYAT